MDNVVADQALSIGLVRILNEWSNTGPENDEVEYKISCSSILEFHLLKIC